ncbi:zinc ribbon domain-containing protein [Acinetobacter indicus]|uniref:zinc ribbon domain-containing protein n=1 Tax=Acinetobacter indicus TaxID=756892 RepID=UPI003F49FACE
MRIVVANHYINQDTRNIVSQGSSCGAITASSPRGRADLRIRVWECECGSVNQRDLNSAKNILALGHKRLAVGITLLSGG